MIVLWGANVLETRMGAESDRRLIEATRRGIPIVVIGPRRSFTAERTGAWWIPCRPGTDAALMLAVLHVLVTEDLADRVHRRTAWIRSVRTVCPRQEGGVAHAP
jgi:anaerobic dimethyl sulfoxide reductase subunit A